MADKKISQLTALSAANVASATDVLAIVDTSATETKKITAKDLIDGALNGGTANGVLYLNGSKVATSGSALTFDGTNLQLGGSGSGARLVVRGTGTTSATFSIEAATSGGATRFLVADDGLCRWYGTSNAETMRLDNAGNLGIGTASPSFKLQVVGNQRIQKDTAGYEAAMLSFSTLTETGAIYRMGMATGGVFAIGRSDTSTTNLTLDSSGNLGLGVTPSAWNSDYKALNIGSKGIVYGRVGSQETAIGANWYRTTAAAFVYASNGFATFYAQDSGNHTWHIAPNNTSGAGATASFTQALTLDSSGNLGVGATTPGQKLEVSGNQRFTGSQVGTKIENRHTTISVTTATTILDDAGALGRFVVVNGESGGNRFCDLVLCSTGANPTVVSSFTSLGTPAARTYTRSGSALQLAMASGTYTVSALAFGY